MGLVRFKLQRFVVEYANEFKKMQQEIINLREKNAFLEEELQVYREQQPSSQSKINKTVSGGPMNSKNDWKF